MNAEQQRQQDERLAAANATLALASQRLDQIERESAAMRSRLDRHQKETAAIQQQITHHQEALGHAPPRPQAGSPAALAEAGPWDGYWDEDDLVAQAIALSLAPEPAGDAQGEGGTSEALEARKAHEEQLTAQVLGSVECVQLDAAEHGDGTVRIGAQRFRRVEHGSAYGGHSNLCFYLAATAGHGPLAVQLKGELAPDATALSRAIGSCTDFAGLATQADTEVVRMYVLRRQTTVIVYNSRARVATSHWAAGSLGATIYLHTDGRHYQRLVPV